MPELEPTTSLARPFTKPTRLLLAAGLAVAALWLASTLTPATSAAAPAMGDGAWRTAPLWDDGLAEFAVYEVFWQRYGNLHPGRAMLVLVKEPWAPDLDVKADQPRPNGFDVLKLNHIRDVATGIYTYHQMASVYVRRADASLVKWAATSSEACGISTAMVRDGELATFSYFDGQGDRRMPYPAGALSRDGLPALLRDFVRGPLPETLLVSPPLLDGRYAKLEPKSFRVFRRDVEAVAVPAGRFEAVELSLAGVDETLTYTFAAEAPHVLLEYRHTDGTRYRLAKVERLAYWSMHDPGGEAWLPEGLRH